MVYSGETAVRWMTTLNVPVQELLCRERCFRLKVFWRRAEELQQLLFDAADLCRAQRSSVCIELDHRVERRHLSNALVLSPVCATTWLRIDGGRGEPKSLTAACPLVLFKLQGLLICAPNAIRSSRGLFPNTQDAASQIRSNRQSHRHQFSPVLPLTYPGVFFRVEAVKKATSLGVTGWIRNTPQHSVQGEAQHKEQSHLDKFTHVPPCQWPLLIRSGLDMRDLLGARLISVSLRRLRTRRARRDLKRSRVTIRLFIEVIGVLGAE
jgi:acylphosphatase